MKEHRVRNYLRNHQDDIVVEVEFRGTGTSPGTPRAVVWVGIDERSMKKILPILIHRDISDTIPPSMTICKKFAESKKGNSRIITPVYTDNPTRRDQEDQSSPNYQVKLVDESTPNVPESTFSGVDWYADQLESKAEKSEIIKADIGYAEEEYVPLQLRIRAPGAIFETEIPFFIGDPSESVFHSAVERMTIPCITLTEEKDAQNRDDIQTNIRRSFIS